MPYSYVLVDLQINITKLPQSAAIDVGSVEYRISFSMALDKLSFYRPLCYNNGASAAMSTYYKCHTSLRTFLFCGIIIKCEGKK